MVAISLSTVVIYHSMKTPKQVTDLIRRVLALKNPPHSLTEVKICAKLGVSFSAFQRWKHKVASPSIDTYFRVSKILDEIAPIAVKKVVVAGEKAKA